MSDARSRGSDARRPLRYLARIFALTCAATAAAVFVAEHLAYNATPSIKVGFYWISRADELRRGDRVLFDQPESVRDLVRARRWLRPGAFMLKEIVAVSGDEVCTTDSDFFAAGRHLGSIPERDSQGRALPRFEFCGRVPAGAYYVGSSAPMSFDSRHFGPVRAEQIRGRAHALWTY